MKGCINNICLCGKASMIVMQTFITDLHPLKKYKLSLLILFLAIKLTVYIRRYFIQDFIISFNFAGGRSVYLASFNQRLMFLFLHAHKGIRLEGT